MKNEKNFKKYLKTTVQILLYVAVVYFIWNRLSGTKDIWKSINEIDMPMLLLSVLVFVLQTLFNGYMWYFLMKNSGEKVKVMQQIKVFLISYLLRYIPGNIVGILSRGELNRKYGVSRLKSLWGWFFENITYLSVGISLSVYFVVKNFSQVVGFSLEFVNRSEVLYIGGGFILILLIISNLLVMYKGDKMWSLFNKYIIKKLLKKNFGKELHVSLNNRSRFLISLGYFVSWGIYSISFLLFTFAVAPQALEYPLALISLNALAWSLGYLFIITPSGTGIRELILLTFLPLIPGISPATSALIAVGMRLVNILGEVGAFVVYKGYNLINKLNSRLD